MNQMTTATLERNVPEVVQVAAAANSDVPERNPPWDDEDDPNCFIKLIVPRSVRRAIRHLAVDDDTDAQVILREAIDDYLLKRKPKKK